MAGARNAPEVMPARICVPSWAVWEVTVFVLNVLAFILVGFQLRSIAARLTAATWASYGAVAAAVCVVVIFARIAWVTGAAALSRQPGRADGDVAPRSRDAVALSAGAAAVVGWCGVRGTVTLATALALPTGGEGGSAFPYRDLIVFTAFGVVLGTLVLQGLTLRPLLLRLGVKDDGMVEREVQRARGETLRAGVEAASGCPGAETAKLARYRYELQLRRAEQELARDGTGVSRTVPAGAAASPVAAADNQLLECRGRGGGCSGGARSDRGPTTAAGGTASRRHDRRCRVPTR
jgi:NhaP-type Na+/H+ or K+/H+ antiporter